MKLLWKTGSMCTIGLAVTSDITMGENGMEDHTQQGQDPVSV